MLLFFFLFPVYTVRCDATDRGRGEGGGVVLVSSP